MGKQILPDRALSVKLYHYPILGSVQKGGFFVCAKPQFTGHFWQALHSWNVQCVFRPPYMGVRYQLTPIYGGKWVQNPPQDSLPKWEAPKSVQCKALARRLGLNTTLFSVEVGTALTGRPPHRTGRA